MRIVLVLILMITVESAFSQLDSLSFTRDNNQYNSELNADFEKFLKLCESDSVINLWQHKKSELIEKTQEVINEVEKTRQYYQVETFAFIYLRTINTYELERKTTLVNDFGNYILTKKLKEFNLGIRFKNIEDKFSKYSNTESAKLYHSDYIEFNNLKYEFGKIEYPPIKLQLEYEASEYAGQNNPDIFTYTLFNWSAQINKIDVINHKLDKIEIDLKNISFIVPKDKTSWITLLIQTAILCSLIPTFLLTYRVKHNPKLILAVVFSSIILSAFLIFINPTTWQNIVFGAIIPGVFYIYYHIKLKGRINGNRISHPFQNKNKIEIKHNFGYTPHVSVYDENDEVVMCAVNSNERMTTVEANIKFSGRVELS